MKRILDLLRPRFEQPLSPLFFLFGALLILLGLTAGLELPTVGTVAAFYPLARRDSGRRSCLAGNPHRTRTAGVQEPVREHLRAWMRWHFRVIQHESYGGCSQVVFLMKDQGRSLGVDANSSAANEAHNSSDISNKRLAENLTLLAHITVQDASNPVAKRS